MADQATLPEALDCIVGYGNCYQGNENTMAPSNNMSFPAPTSATADSNNSMRSEPGTSVSDARASENEVFDEYMYLHCCW